MSKSELRQPEQVKPEQVKVVAISDGWYRGRRIRAGRCFELQAGDRVGSWMKIVKDVPLTTTVVVPGQTTLSEMARANTGVTPMAALQRKA